MSSKAQAHCRPTSQSISKVYRQKSDAGAAMFASPMTAMVFDDALLPGARDARENRFRILFVDTGQGGCAPRAPISIPVPTIAETTTGADAAKVLGALTHCTRGINYLGLPAASVPAGFTSNGMPCAFQLVGRPFAEALLLRAADAYQRVTDWHRRVPASV
jgi:hypothetical protein